MGHSVSKNTPNLSKNDVMYGVLNDWSSCSTLNHLIIIGKYYLYCKALKWYYHQKNNPFFSLDFKTMLTKH